MNLFILKIDIGEIKVKILDAKIRFITIKSKKFKREGIVTEIINMLKSSEFIVMF
ncbi:hypothetical protein CPJCM30710_23020 [Clostridium polyendosporum]|uniref:Uncharacterized protein n=1 Tax=Clostridium polyendosporum TaxID=69208 RepID=A0A919S1L2_9CLOT|nr:hypothetical protein CPJCM30710_23020 [Clostridium polyendosporum]